MQGSLALAYWASLAVCYRDRALRFWRFLRELAVNTTKGRLLNQKGPLLSPQLAPRPSHAPLCKPVLPGLLRGQPPCQALLPVRPRLKGNSNVFLRKTNLRGTHGGDGRRGGGDGWRGSKQRDAAEDTTSQAAES
jgi:hypothetical protein